MDMSMSSWVHSFMPQFSFKAFVFFDILIGMAVISGWNDGWTEKISKKWDLSCIMNWVEFFIVVIATEAIVILEHYAGIVQLVINFLGRNYDSHAAWGDIISLTGIAIFATFVAYCYFKLKNVVASRKPKLVRTMNML